MDFDKEIRKSVNRWWTDLENGIAVVEGQVTSPPDQLVVAQFKIIVGRLKREALEAIEL